jgi:hypothetical protein
LTGPENRSHTTEATERLKKSLWLKGRLQGLEVAEAEVAEDAI